MIRLLISIAVLVLGLPALASPLGTRWTSQPLDGAVKMVSGGPGNTTLVVLRSGQDPLRSFDGGRTWTSFTVNGARPADISLAPAEARTWYAITAADAAERTPKVVLQTRDGGYTWEERSSVVQRYPIAPQVGSDSSHLFLLSYDLVQDGWPEPPGSFARVLSSRDAGRTWTEPSPELRVNRFVRSKVHPLLAYATPAGALAGKVVRTLDGGVTWTEMALPTQGASLVTSIMAAHIALDRVNPNIAYIRPEQRRGVASSDLYVTRDAGHSWARGANPEGLVIPDPAAEGRVYLAALDGRFVESRDSGLTWVTVDIGGPQGSASNWIDDAQMFTVTHYGVREGVSIASGKLGRFDLTFGAVALGSDLWWNPAESGAGFTITQHTSNKLFVVWYTYDATGAPVWRVMPGLGSWSDRTFGGPIYETTGPRYFGATFDPSRVGVRLIGGGTLKFWSENQATFEYTVDGILVSNPGVAVSKPLVRQTFGVPSTDTFLTGESYADLWWNPAESGWGMAINHQQASIFATWYAYGDDGKPLWIVMPEARLALEMAGVFTQKQATGDIYTTRGPAEGTAFDPARVVVTKVGTATLHFRSVNEVVLDYTAFGRTESRTLTRQPF